MKESIIEVGSWVSLTAAAVLIVLSFTLIIAHITGPKILYTVAAISTLISFGIVLVTSVVTAVASLWPRRKPDRRPPPSD